MSSRIDRIVAHTTRLKILYHLWREEAMTTEQLGKRTNIPEPVVDYHLTILEECGFVERRGGSGPADSPEYAPVLDDNPGWVTDAIRDFPG